MLLFSSFWPTHTCTIPYRECHRFCRAVRVDKSNLKEKSFDDIISSTLSLITVLFENVFDAVNIHNRLIDRKYALDPQPSISLMNKTEISDGFVFEGGIIKNEDYSPLQKELLKLLEGVCVFGYGEYYNNLLCILVDAYKTIYGIKTTVPKKLIDMLYMSSKQVTGHMIRRHKYIPPDIYHS